MYLFFSFFLCFFWIDLDRFYEEGGEGLLKFDGTV